jgi:biotin carboxyl carrier protein
MTLELLLNNQIYTLEIKTSQHPAGSTWIVRIGEKEYPVDYRQLDPMLYSLIIQGRSYQAFVYKAEGNYVVDLKGKTYSIQILDEAGKRLRISRASTLLGQRVISAPMPGKVIKLLVKVGDLVEAGQGVVVVEAMKMENELRASIRGTVKEIKVSEGMAVNSGEPLVILE